MARKSGPVSIYSIAKELNVSPSAVSRVINNRIGVSEETRRNVAELLKKYNFKANYPQQRKTRIAMVSRNTLISPYTSAAISGIRNYVHERNLMLCSIFYEHNNSEPLLSVIRDQQCSGVLLLNADDFERYYPELDSSGLPVMLIDTATQYPNIGFIDNDSYLGSYAATKHLLELGHRRIGYLLCRTGLNHIQRHQAYRNAMADAGVCVREEWVCERGAQNLKNDIQYGARMFHELIRRVPDLTAVMATNDNFAMGAIHSAVELGLRVPDDLSIVGFDDYDFSEFTNPALTTVMHPVEEAGRLAAKAVDDYLKANGTVPLPRQILPTKLLVRNSTGPVRRQ